MDNFLFSTHFPFCCPNYSISQEHEAETTSAQISSKVRLKSPKISLSQKQSLRDNSNKRNKKPSNGIQKKFFVPSSPQSSFLHSKSLRAMKKPELMKKIRFQQQPTTQAYIFPSTRNYEEQWGKEKQPIEKKAEIIFLNSNERTKTKKDKRASQIVDKRDKCEKQEKCQKLWRKLSSKTVQKNEGTQIIEEPIQNQQNSQELYLPLNQITKHQESVLSIEQSNDEREKLKVEESVILVDFFSPKKSQLESWGITKQ